MFGKNLSTVAQLGRTKSYPRARFVVKPVQPEIFFAAPHCTIQPVDLFIQSAELSDITKIGQALCGRTKAYLFCLKAV